MDSSRRTAPYLTEATQSRDTFICDYIMTRMHIRVDFLSLSTSEYLRLKEKEKVCISVSGATRVASPRAVRLRQALEK